MSKGKAVVDVVVNNEQSRKRIQEMTADFDALRKKKTEALLAGNGKLADSIQKEMSVVKRELRQMNKHVVDVDNVLRNLNKIPLSQLHAAQRKLRTEQQGLTRDSVEYAETQVKINKIEEELANARGKRSESMLSKGAMWAGGAAALALLQRYGKGAVEVYARLDDKMADVIKTTGLTKDEVKQLDAVLMQLDTRTTREDLLDLARVAGKLGVTGVEDVAGFVRAADQIRVALTEDLGGDVEESIRKLGKLTDIFGLKQELGLEKSLISIGSAINSLGAASTANEEFLVTFANRTAGIAPGANISLQNILGLGAAMDNLGQSAEVGSTSYSKVITGMFKNTSEYAKVAGMDVKEFSRLLKEDANEAFLKFLEGVNSGGGMEGVVQRLSGLKLSGQGVTQVIGALAGNIGLIREQQALANEEFAKATSLTEEYNTKNTSAAAILEKREKEIKKAVATLGEQLMPLWSEGIGLTGNFMNAIAEMISWATKYKGVLFSLIGAAVAHVTITKLQMFWSAAHRAQLVAEVATLGTATASTKLLAASKLLLVGNLRAAGTAFKMFFASIGPVGWIIAGIAGISSVMSILGTKTRAAMQSVKDLNEVNKRANDTYVEEKWRLQELLKVASNKNVSDRERERAMKKLQELMPNGIDLINKETIANGKAKEAVDKYCEALLLRAKIEAGKDMLVEMEKERLNALQDGNAGALSFFQKTGVLALNALGLQGAAANKMVKNVNSNLNEFEAEYEKRGQHIASMVAGWQKEATGINGSLGGDDNDDDEGGGGSKDSSKWSLDKDRQFMTDKIELRKKLNSGEIATEEEHNRQLLALEIEALDRRISANIEKGEDHLKLQSDLADKRYQQTKTEQTRIDRLLAASLEGGDKDNTAQLYQKEQSDYERRLKELGLFNRKRDEMTAQELAALLNLERNHTNKLQSIYTDRLVNDVKQKQTEIQRAVNAMKIAHNAELTQADTLAKKKALISELFTTGEASRVRTDREADRLLKQHYQKVEEDALKKHFEALRDTHIKMMAELKSINDSGVSIGNLNPEEVERVQAIIDNLNQQLSNLRTTAPGNEVNDLKKVDVLGFSTSDWEQLFANLEEGKMGLDNWQVALGAIGNAFGDISRLMAATEKAEMREYEKTAKKKKATLDKQLRDGLLSETMYNEAVRKIDEDTDAKREEMEHKQAVREKALAVFQALVNTALGITAALTTRPAWLGIALASTVGALGAVQVATILKTPIPGAEEGGEIGVTRAQDGKQFSAKNAPNKRGHIDTPTVLVAEDGPEYVVPNEGYENPTIRPVLDMFEQARRNGTLGSIDLPAVMNSTMQGRSGGGYIGGSDGSQAPSTDTPSEANRQYDDKLITLMEQSIAINTKLQEELKGGVNVVLTGSKGLFAKVKEFNNVIENTRG